MNIQEIRYIDDDRNAVLVLFDDGTSANCPTANNFSGLYGEDISTWLSSGNHIIDMQKESIDMSKEIDRQEIYSDMEDLLGDMTTPEAMFLMLRYGMAKMQGGDSDDPSDGDLDSLTPTGEDIITWGDSISESLEKYVRNLRRVGK